MLFRHRLTQQYSVGARGQKISQRTIKTSSDKPAILLVDCSYLAFLLESRHKSKQSNCYNGLTEKRIKSLRSGRASEADRTIIYNMRQVVLDAVIGSIRLVNPSYIILIEGSSESLLETTVSTEFVSEVLKPFNWKTYKLTGDKFSDYVFSFLQKNSTGLNQYKTVYLTNSITTWACCSHTLEHGMIAIGKNLRPIYYNNKTGLDLVCKFINTSKIINKLGLDDVKYVNLQYLYILILYVMFLHHKKEDSTFFFDAEYFKKVKHVEYNKFLRSNGEGLEMISDAHKTLSYIFLTKPDLMDQFLFYTTDNFILNLKRLAKVTQFDVNLLSHLSTYYNQIDRLRDISFRKGILFSFCEAALIRDRTKEDLSKVVFFPNQYLRSLTSIERKSSQTKKVSDGLEVSEVSDDNKIGSDAVSRILRNLLW